MMLLGIGLGLVLSGGLAAILLRRLGARAEALFVVLVGSGCALASVPPISVLVGRPPPTVTLAFSGPGGPWAFGLDRLSSWFLVCIVGVGAAAAVFGVPYLAPQRHHRPTGLAHAGLAVLVVALVGVVTSQAVLPFMAAWELMAVTAYLLVIFESDQSEVRRAGMIYVVLTHVSMLALLGMFAGWASGAGGLTFGDLAAAPPGTFVLVLALLGFGIKAGVVPMHFWLPGAHAAAPSHVSAMLSGVMLKTGIYGLLRVLSLIGTPPAWWGWSLLSLGLVSGVLGVLWALAQHDLKRLLAYHSVENIGIILLGMGVGALGLTYQQPIVALLGLTGAVLHSMNHALFKSLLFLGAGAVVQAARTRTIDRLGGLAPRMPWTALMFVLGSVAIVGLPPLNGFVSEWVVFQALLNSGASAGVVRMAIVAAAVLALIGGLALACFAKVNGIVFLGRARSIDVGAVREPGPAMLGPMVLLALACLLLGVFPAVAVDPALAIAGAFVGSGMGDAAGLAVLSDDVTRVGGLGLALLLSSAFVWLARRRQGASRPVACTETWACAGTEVTPRMQYTASSFASPLLAPLRPVAGLRELRGPTSFHAHPFDLLLDGLVLPAWRQVGRLAREARVIQGGRLSWYLLYVIITVIGLLAYLTTFAGP